MGCARGGGIVLSIIRTVAETGSTNADLIALAHAGAQEGFWLRAETQTAGRGRQGRNWVSPSGNLYTSTLVRLRPRDPAAPTLGFVAALALHEAVAMWMCEPGIVDRLRIKWPNDILIGEAKLAGILLERTGDAVVIGIGVNLVQHPETIERRATSLAACGVDVSPAAVLDALAESFARWVSRWRNEGFDTVRTAWLDRAHPVGSALAVHSPGSERVEGLFDGLNRDGALILRLADGTRHVMHAGDVFLI